MEKNDWLLENAIIVLCCYPRASKQLLEVELTDQILLELGARYIIDYFIFMAQRVNRDNNNYTHDIQVLIDL